MTPLNPPIDFLFIVAIPLVLVFGALATLFLVGALFDALDHPEELRGRIQALFRRPPRDPKTPGKQHYYRPYWLAGEQSPPKQS